LVCNLTLEQRSHLYRRANGSGGESSAGPRRADLQGPASCFGAPCAIHCGKRKIGVSVQLDVHVDWKAAPEAT